MTVNADDELLMEVLDFLKQYPNYRHYIVCSDEAYVSKVIQTLLSPFALKGVEFIHPGRSLTGWTANGPACALSCTRVIIDASAYAQLCSRLRHSSSVYHVRARFSVYEPNANILRAMYPMLFKNSHGENHAFSNLTSYNLTTTTNSIQDSMVPKLGADNGNPKIEC